MNLGVQFPSFDFTTTQLPWDAAFSSNTHSSARICLYTLYARILLPELTSRYSLPSLQPSFSSIRASWHKNVLKGRKRRILWRNLTELLWFFRSRHGPEDLEFKSKLDLSYTWFSEIADALSVLRYNSFVKKFIGECLFLIYNVCYRKSYGHPY